ncbi:MAG: molybdate ABC transporter substrate-binding protein [Rhodoglobus sp.]
MPISQRGRGRTVRGGLAAFAAVGVLLAGCAIPVAETGSPDPTPATQSALAGQLTVFAAASLTTSFTQIADAFMAEHPEVTVVLNFGGSSGLASQIVQGAPADVFAAANEISLAPVTGAGLAGDPVVFATNTLEIAVPPGNPAEVAGLPDFSRSELAIALCAVEVPCGAASKEVLTAAGVAASVDSYEQEVTAVLTKVRLGEVDAGLVYRTDVLAARETVQGIEFAGATATVARYPIVTLTDAPNSEAAVAFVTYVLSSVGQKTLKDAGFGEP